MLAMLEYAFNTNVLPLSAVNVAGRQSLTAQIYVYFDGIYTYEHPGRRERVLPYTWEDIRAYGGPGAAEVAAAKRGALGKYR